MAEIKNIKTDNLSIKINCYGEIVEIPYKYKNRINILPINISDDEVISLEISKCDMIQILYIFRDNLQVLNKKELEKIRIDYNLNKGFLKHFDYLGIDTDAINKQIKEEKEEKKEIIIKSFIEDINKNFTITGPVCRQAGSFEFTKEFYIQNKQIIDKIISNRNSKNKYKNCLLYFIKCNIHVCVIFYNDEIVENLIKEVKLMDCFYCEK